MKKKLFIFILISFSAFALNLRVGITGSDGSMGTKDGIRQKNSTSYYTGAIGFRAEITQDFINGELGGGISYESRYKLDETQKFNQIPIYLLGKINFSLVEDLNYKSFLVGKIGKTIYSGDYKISNGNYYAIGAGIEYKERIQYEIAYSIRGGKIGNREILSEVMSIGIALKIL